MAKKKKRTLLDPSNLPGTFASRVFVGGSYKAAAAASRGRIAPREMLEKLKKVVARMGLDPIVADEYEVQDVGRDIHHDAIYLLHACRLAVFEFSEFSGALMEIERSADYGTQCIVLHEDPKATGWRLSRMLSSFVQQHHSRIRLYGYASLAEALNATRNWIEEMKRLGHAKDFVNATATR